MGLGPINACRQLIARANCSVKDLDLIEINEAFASQSIQVHREMGWDMDKVNVHGGAIALGHPVGASGTRILVTLLYEMARRDVMLGLRLPLYRRRSGNRHDRRTAQIRDHGKTGLKTIFLRNTA